MNRWTFDTKLYKTHMNIVFIIMRPQNTDLQWLPFFRTMDRVGALCSSVGGVCGWSCGATIATREAQRTKTAMVWWMVKHGMRYSIDFFTRKNFEGWIYRYHGFHDLLMKFLRFKVQQVWHIFANLRLSDMDKQFLYGYQWPMVINNGPIASNIWLLVFAGWARKTWYSLGDSEFPGFITNLFWKTTLNSNFAGLSWTLGCGIYIDIGSNSYSSSCQLRNFLTFNLSSRYVSATVWKTWDVSAASFHDVWTPQHFLDKQYSCWMITKVTSGSMQSYCSVALLQFEVEFGVKLQLQWMREYFCSRINYI